VPPEAARVWEYVATTNAYGALVTARVNGYETNAGNALFANSGWTLTGGAATNGALTLTWLWKTNYWLATTNGGGALNFDGGAPGWNPSTNSVTIMAAADSNWHFVAWGGDTGGCATAGAQLTAPMTQARTVIGTFGITPGTVSLSINYNATNTGLVWLGATNLPFGATGSLLRATSLLDGNWQIGAPFVITTTATNWSAPVAGSNALYRLRMQ